MRIDLDHIVLNVADVDRLVEFYRTVFWVFDRTAGRIQSGAVPFTSARINVITLIDLFPPKM